MGACLPAASAIDCQIRQQHLVSHSPGWTTPEDGLLFVKKETGGVTCGSMQRRGFGIPCDGVTDRTRRLSRRKRDWQCSP
jgi:hypothetical protein